MVKEQREMMLLFLDSVPKPFRTMVLKFEHTSRLSGKLVKMQIAGSQPRVSDSEGLDGVETLCFYVPR